MARVRRTSSSNEVKRFDDGRLWGNKPPVLDQIEKYDTFLQSKELKLKTAYTNVCKLLSELVPKKDLSPVVSEVALGLGKVGDRQGFAVSGLWLRQRSKERPA
jgi:hypothetical protein